MSTINPTSRIVQLTWAEIRVILLQRGIKQSIIKRLDQEKFFDSIKNLPPAIRQVKIKVYQRTGKW